MLVLKAQPGVGCPVKIVPYVRFTVPVCLRQVAQRARANESVLHLPFKVTLYKKPVLAFGIQILIIVQPGTGRFGYVGTHQQTGPVSQHIAGSVIEYETRPALGIKVQGKFTGGWPRFFHHKHQIGLGIVYREQLVTHFAEQSGTIYISDAVFNGVKRQRVSRNQSKFTQRQRLIALAQSFGRQVAEHKYVGLVVWFAWTARIGAQLFGQKLQLRHDVLHGRVAR